MMEFFGEIVIAIQIESFYIQSPASGSFPINFGNRLRSYSDPLPLDLDPSFENEKQFHGTQGLSSVPPRQATSNCVEYQARRGGGTTIPYHGSLLGRSLASP